MPTCAFITRLTPKRAFQRPPIPVMLKHIKKIGGDRGGYILDAITADVGKILDIGCAFGWTLGALTGKAQELVGIDMDAAALEQAKKNYPNVKFIIQTATTLPFEDNMFDIVILSEVIEHVGDENKQCVIDEAYRVLKKGGLFIFTAPYDGLFAWADPMDFKRRFPRIYRLYMRLTRYTPETAIEVGHKHISLPEIRGLFGERFEIEQIRYCGLLMPMLTWILAIDVRLRLLPRRLHEGLNKFRGWESGVVYPKMLAFNVRLLARKKAGTLLAEQGIPFKDRA